MDWRGGEGVSVLRLGKLALQCVAESLGAERPHLWFFLVVGVADIQQSGMFLEDVW